MTARRQIGALAGACALVVAAYGPTGAAPGATGPTSIVQLGDSIASGEGTRYGYTYDAAAREWTGGNVDAVWPGPYPRCHDSPDAYGQKVASYFGARFHQFACTGATFAAGVAAPQAPGGTQYRPAQFGDWAKRQDLNAEYDQAQPDVVLVTLGADDLRFVPIVKACIENGYEHYFHLAALTCVAGNPGGTIRHDVFDALPKLKKRYATLVQWIEQRARANRAPAPKIVFTTYPDPLPPTGTRCPDTNWLYPAQVRYLATLLDKVDKAIVSAVKPLHDDNAAVADVSAAYTPPTGSHRWCSKAPWAYGLSIYRILDPTSFESQAPFHPTPRGQESVAEHVIPVVKRIFTARS